METEANVDDLVDRWELLGRHGTPPTIEELCAGRPELAAEVRRRIEALRAIDSALDTEARQPTTTADRGGPGAGPAWGLPEVLRATAVYRPRRHHDQGGLGVIWIAHEEELDRTVALKRIRPDRLHDVARWRFLREAALTARLQHPGIVPIYGLGRDESGPFYTMPFIEGRTLQEAIGAFHGEGSPRLDPGGRGLRLRELLQHFIAACNTVAYAHDRGVVHRDLKPSNLMLGPYGETLVMDWGLAKRFGAGEAPGEGAGDAPSPDPSSEDVTETGEVLGTPQYMSPEQARGEPAGPAGDIFSLGLVLYGILTGKSAFDESSLRGPDRLRAVRDAAIVPPRRRDPRLPRALEAICLKALAARAEDRYPSARALGEDLARWLADEPVTAWREPFSARARRWRRRHRTAVAAAVVALAAGVIGLGAVAAVQARGNTRLKEALDHTEAVSLLLGEAIGSLSPSQVDPQRKVAAVLDRASALVDQGFKESPVIQGKILSELGRIYSDRGLYDQAVSLDTKAAAVLAAALGPDHPETLGTRNNLAEAYRETGRLPEAIALHEMVFGRREAVLGPDHLDTLQSRHNLAAAYLQAGRLSEAIALLKEVIRLCEAKLGPDHPGTLQSRTDLAAAYYFAGRTREAIKLGEETLERSEAVLGPDHPWMLATRSNLAAAYLADGRMGEAIDWLKDTLRLREAKLGPDHPHTLESRINLAIADLSAGRTGEAMALLEATLKLSETKLGPDHPDSLLSRINLAEAYESLGQSAEAEDLDRDVLARRRKAVPPESPLLARDLAALGRNLLTQSRCSEAEPLLREGLEIQEKATPDDWSRYGSMSLLGGSLLGQGRYAEAEPSVVAGYEGMKAREERIPVPDRSRLLREAAERVIRLYEAWGRPEEAATWKTRAGMPDLPADVFARP
jgi:tetratricopeptide (TPR) repeat protein/tRNA A-37 threonylcarbamoyl transferase component Bud32